ncbi:MAG: hypothetical protein LAT50_09820 [Ectothiorhodospiraceae bacterium]|nr:hypothetical protein [Ectothiorhodospiraceae bacterium]
MRRGAFTAWLAAAACALPLTAAAEETDRELPTLIIEQAYPNLIDTSAEGRYRLNRRDLDEFGAASGDFTRMLDLLPNVQFGESRQSEDRLRDLRPESGSISGGRFYENTFRLDGLSIDDRLDPASRDAQPNSITDVPGHEQSVFVDSELLESITVYDSNVPAAYGRFTGGVVDLETRRAGPRPRTRLGYSGTHSDWVSYRVFQPEPANPEAPREPPEPKEFSRDRLIIGHERPIGDASGLVLSLARSRASTPELQLGDSNAQRSENLNLLGKFSTPLSQRSYADITLNYAPYRHERFIKNARDSDFTIAGGGGGATVSVDHLTVGGTEARLRLGLNYSENSRKANTDYFNWSITDSRPWGGPAGLTSSQEGGFGDLNKTQLGASVGLTLTPPVQHWMGRDFRFTYGAETNYSRLRVERPETLHIYRDPRINPDIDCRGRSRDCIQNEQYFRNRNIYLAEDVTVGLTEYALHGEATTDFGRLTATLGLRYDHDDFLRNHDLAWRSRFSYDVFGTDSTVLTAGFNRYYGGSLLTYKLREAQRPMVMEYRGASQNVVGDWETDSGGSTVRFHANDARTPYSDEQAYGLRQRLFGGVAALSYVRRDNRDEFSQFIAPTGSDGTRARFLTNEGRSTYQGVSAAWRRQWGRTTLGLNITYSETESNNERYDDSIEGVGNDDYVAYRGKAVRRGRLDVQRTDFNRPLVGSVSVAQRFGRSLQASAVTRYRGRYTNIEDTGATTMLPVPDGAGGETEQVVPVYADRERPSTLITDFRLAYAVHFAERYRLALEAELGNVFNSRTYTVSSGGRGIEVGRSIWLGGQLEF